MKIAIFGEKYSDNLGDGVISECLAFAFSNAVSDVSVQTYDLSMRDNFKFGSVERDDNSVNSFQVFYRRIKKLVGWEFFRKPKFYKKYGKYIKSADVVLIGGGQIFLDNELNFPVKLRVLSKILDDHEIKRAFICCGVSRNMSLIGRNIFKRLLTSKSVLALVVRDLNSIENAKAVLQYQSPIFLLDPAIISSDVYGNTNILPYFPGRTIGLNIMDFITLEKCFENKIDRNEILNVWVELIKMIVGDGHRVILHTNGAAEDNFALNSLLQYIVGMDNVIVKLPSNPRELANIISSVDVLLAYRLHANILAFSLKVPSVGIVWDDKVTEFASISCRNDYFVSVENIEANHLYMVINKAIAEQVDDSKLDELKIKFYDGVVDLVSKFQSSL
jgi:polysaccharide pyruvyl transferase WcaK-like protein